MCAFQVVELYYVISAENLSLSAISVKNWEPTFPEYAAAQ